ncbi:MAG TPA: hypothetical protein VN625_10380, partial [Desulfuromonadaceae bacterium]|nr:hypothetical protein [Desulfuromonadaceae bacterium]
ANRQCSGVALIITLILLSVTLVMAVAFLFISRREQGSVTTQTDAAAARLAADTALAHAEAQIAADMFASGRLDPNNVTLLVSTNYLTPITGNVTDWANLFIYPRLPVYVPLSNPPVAYDFPFYLDLNRNGAYDTNGEALVFNGAHSVIGTNFNALGDPEWIGMLERPDQFHGPNNKGVARYAYIAVPIGNSLDLNAIHNQAHRGVPTPPGTNFVNPPGGVAGSHDDIFTRNESVGSWEINLAAFLADLNTNRWAQQIGDAANGNANWYFYQHTPPYNHGAAFDNARELLAFRYANDFRTLQVPQRIFPNNAAEFSADLIDGYSYGSPFMTGFQMPADNDANLLFNQLPWVGADNTNQFFDLPADLFDRTKTATLVSPADLSARKDFTSRLIDAGNTNNSTYEQTTFYRLLEQLGTDSEPESGMVNVNYSNAIVRFDVNGVATNITMVPGAETNMTPWLPLQFFTVAADRLLRTYTAKWSTAYFTNPAGFVLPQLDRNYLATFHVNGPFSVTNIPVLVSNQFVYTPAVNRLLQMAANIYDATSTNRYPSVFRPIIYSVLENGWTNIYVHGYQQVNGVALPYDFEKAPFTMPVDIRSGTNLYPGVVAGQGVVYTNINVYGVPWIIGAKKYIPNFNEFAIETSVHVERKLEVMRDTNTSPPTMLRTNQMYVMSISNWLGVESWNSYSNQYPSPFALTIMARAVTYLDLTNDSSLK